MSGVGEIVRGWRDSLLAFFYPELCQVCNGERARPGDGFVCGRCWRKVRFIREPFCARCGLPYDGEITQSFECSNCRDMELHFRFARSAVTTGGPVLDVIHRYKYNRARWFEPFLADLLIREAVPGLQKEHWDWIVPVPLHPLRQREREFNQAERLSLRLSRATGIPVHAGLLNRALPTRTQTQLTRKQRAANVQHAFTLRGNPTLKGKRIVVLDDVLTTGATTSACARMLRRAGAEDVCVWTVARGT